MTWILIVGSGTGTRFGSKIPKQFLDLAGIPIIAWSIIAFKRALPEASLVLTIPKGKAYQQLTKERLAEFIDFCDGIVEGGAHRQESVIKGLKWIHSRCDDCKILIHDAARPFVNVDLIKRVHEQIERGNAVVPTIQPAESIRIQTNDANQPISRELVHLVQTPQGFYLKDLLVKLNKLSETYSTDEASLFGSNVKIIEGDRRNIKITFPEDLIIAEAMVSAGLVEKPDIYGS